MTKETIKELEKIHNYCMNKDCEDCVFSHGDYLDCIFLNTPHRWNIKELKRIIQGGISYDN